MNPDDMLVTVEGGDSGTVEVEVLPESSVTAADEDAGAYPQGTFIGLVALRAAHEWLEADTASLSRSSCFRIRS